MWCGLPAHTTRGNCQRGFCDGLLCHRSPTAVEAGIREAYEERRSHNGGTYIDNEVHAIYVVRKEIDLRQLRLDPAEVAEVALVRSFDGYDLVPHVTEFVPR